MPACAYAAQCAARTLRPMLTHLPLSHAASQVRPCKPAPRRKASDVPDCSEQPMHAHLGLEMTDEYSAAYFSNTL